MSKAIDVLHSLESSEFDMLSKLDAQAKQMAQNDRAVRQLLEVRGRLQRDRPPDPGEIQSPRREFETREEYVVRERRWQQEAELFRAVNESLAQNQTALDRELDRARRAAWDTLLPPRLEYVLLVPVELGTFDIDHMSFTVQTSFYQQSGTLKKVKVPVLQSLVESLGPVSFYYVADNAAFSVGT